MSNLIQKVGESEVKISAKNGKNYKVVTFQTINKTIVKHPILGDVVVSQEAKSVSLTCWELNIKGTTDLGYAEPVGNYFMGNIITKAVDAYVVDGKMVASDTTVVFGDTSSASFEDEVKLVFQRRAAARAKATATMNTSVIPSEFVQA